MPVFHLEEVSERVHQIKEMTRDKKARRIVVTKCGQTLETDAANFTGWDQDVTCPDCAVPWV